MVLSSGPLGQLAEWVTNIVHTFGYIGVAVLTALENLVPPIPSELILPLAGFLAGQGRFQLPFVILAGTIGSLVGAIVLYGLGYWLGDHRLRWFIQKYGRWLLLEEDDLDKAEEWFHKHGRLAVFLARLVPGARSFISIPAGVDRMSIPLFLVYTTIGSAVWNSVLVLLGWGLGSQWQRVQDYAQYLEWVALALAIGAIGWFINQRKFKKKRGDAEKRHPAEAG